MWLQVYWPGMLLSAGLALPRRVFGHGFLTSRGLKMGKSMGNVVDPQARNVSQSAPHRSAVGPSMSRHFAVTARGYGAAQRVAIRPASRQVSVKALRCRHVAAPLRGNKLCPTLFRLN